MLSSVRQVSKWFLASKPLTKCLPITASVSDALPAPVYQRSLSVLSSRSTSLIHHGIKQGLISHKTPSSTLLANGSKPVNIASVRNYERVYYKPSIWKRYNKHNLEKRLTSNGGLEVLWRRVLKGRHNLAVYERILPNTHDSKILYKHQLRFRKHPLTKHRLPKPGLY